ncbi:hypothetical protein [Trichococcus shcherbakoviae]|uniref:hypothetical protein n=1 Tax=Trichococcus shcherbakoviae TaxID=2094020 RepID=UPI002AA6AB06|nr:hypothetical protein [Trichococcus shcherbakoviae]
MENESENELTRVEVVLHNFNRAAIDTFLVSNGIEADGDDWGRKIKQVLRVIDEGQLKNDKGADKMVDFKAAYLEEVKEVKEVVRALEETLEQTDEEYEIITDEGQPNEKSNWISREEFLEFMIEYAINTLSGNVGYIFLDDEK